MPLPLTAQQAGLLTHLTAVSTSSEDIAVVVEITSLEPWRDADGIERWLPFLGHRIPLLRPIPLGDRGLLNGWLPRWREQVQLINLDALLRADRLSDLLPGSGAHCPWPPAPGVAAARAGRAA
jgi:hypothetical protein